MISHIYGEIAQCEAGFVVIDVGGIGYHVNVTKPVLDELKDKKEKVKLYTHLHIREDAFMLYGFLNQIELRIFRLLISVTRIGPQVAMNILSRIKIEELSAAIIQEDEKVLTSISGVGTKNARRMILELKDKIKKSMEESAPGMSNTSYDAVSALVSLGFQSHAAKTAVDAVSGEQKDVETIIKAALLRLKETK